MVWWIIYQIEQFEEIQSHFKGNGSHLKKYALKTPQAVVFFFEKLIIFYELVACYICNISFSFI